jgi:OOP family OmpA-OmpF porin
MFFMASLLALVSAGARADDTSGLWGFGVGGGWTDPLANGAVRRASDPGSFGAAWLRYGLSPRWGAQLSYDNVGLKDSGVRLQPLAFSVLYTVSPRARWTPVVSLGAGPSFTRNLSSVDRNRATLGLRAGLGLEYFVTPRFNVGAQLNWHDALKSGRYTQEAQVLAPGLFATWFFACDCDEPRPAPRRATAPKPAAPAPTPVAAEAPRVDTDGDGVIDAADLCAGTPAGTVVDAHGCPLDSDGDGVIDASDKCPGTPAGALVDAVGCPAQKVSIEFKIQFDAGKSVVKPEFRDELTKAAAFIQTHPDTTVEIEGHTDSMGAAAMNRALSQQRADAVRSALVNEFGAPADRVTAKGYGAARPVADNASAEGRAKNRRVVMTLSGTKK